jgi:hypothetical protein
MDTGFAHMVARSPDFVEPHEMFRPERQQYAIADQEKAYENPDPNQKHRLN